MCIDRKIYKYVYMYMYMLVLDGIHSYDNAPNTKDDRTRVNSYRPMYGGMT